MGNSDAIAKAWRRINWIGVIAGVLTIALPFLGKWWQLTLGTGVVFMEISPFGTDIIIFEESVSGAIGSPLLWWFLLGIKLVIVYLGVVLLAGSVLSISDRHVAIAEQFIHFSARKLLWLVVAFVAILFLFIVIVNHAPGIHDSSIGNAPFLLQTDLPYLIGEGEVSSVLEVMRFTCPIRMEFTKAFGIAVLAAALGVATRIYQKRLHNEKEKYKQTE